jgi:hypothetical protein
VKATETTASEPVEVAKTAMKPTKATTSEPAVKAAKTTVETSESAAERDGALGSDREPGRG